MADNKTLVDQLINLIANETEPQANTNTRVAAALTALRDYFDENIQDPDEFLQFVLQTKSSDEKRVARSNIDAAQSGGATGTLKQVEDGLAQLAGGLDDRIVELESHKNPMVVMTENEYDALEIKDPDTYYLIIED